MLIAINIIVVCFLLAMIYWMGSQGLFSSLIHLCATIAAAAIAFAFWEPLAYALMGVKPQLAWTVGLVLPFGLILLGLRYALDKLIPGNMKFQPLVDFIGGGALGLLSAIITAGIVILGAGLLPMGGVWYQALSLQASGGVAEARGLVVPVDRWAFGIFSGLSTGAFSSNRPLAYYNPHLPRQVHLVRLSYDPKASIVALPDSISIDGVYVQPTPVAELSPAVATGLGEGFKQRANKLVVVDTQLQPTAGTFDPDMTVRIPPTQVQLVTQTATGTRIDAVQLHAPLAVSQELTGSGERVFRPFDSDETFAFATKQENLGWAFVVEEDQTPMYLLVRNTRLMLPDEDEFSREVEPLKETLGYPPGSSEGGLGVTADGGGQPPSTATDADNLAAGVELTSSLPADISKNYARGLSYDTTNPELITSGNDVARDPPTGLGRRTRASGIYVPSHKAMVRVKLSRERAQELLGAGQASEARQRPLYLEGAGGNPWLPSAYVAKMGNGAQHIRVGDPMQNAEELPIGEMTPGSDLYLYFMIDRGVTLTRLHIGDQTLPINVQTP